MLQAINIFLLLLSSTLVCAPNTEQSQSPPSNELKENKIYWDADQKLRWSDFQSSANNNAHLDAYSTLGISYVVLHNTAEVIEMGVYGYFEKNKSWVKKNEKTDHLLNHEQSHFDLCELYRRILKKRFAAFDNFTYANVNYEMKRIFQEVFDEYDQIQQRYDRETNHSIIKLKQQQWDDYIKVQIAEHSEFKGDFVALKIRVK